MLLNKKGARRSVSLLAAAGLAGAMLAANPLAANAAATVVNFNSTTPADYAYLSHIGGGGGVDWAPWADADTLNAPAVTGASNWHAREGWAHGWAVQDDGSMSNNALWVQKAQAGAASSGIQLGVLADGQSFISSSNKSISLKVKAFDDAVPVSATLTDIYGGQPITVLATATTKNVYNTLTFNFASPTTGTYIANYSYSKLSVVFDPENAIAGNAHENWGQGAFSATNSKAYIVDDLTYTVATGDPAPGPDVPHKLTFENSDTLGAGAYGESTPPLHPGGFFGGAGTGQGTPPVAHTGMALEFNKAAAGQVWSGVTVLSAPEGEVLTSATYKHIAFDYYSPDTTATPLLMKVESAGPTLINKLSATPGWNHFDVDASTLTGWAANVQFLRLVLIPDFDPDSSAAMVPMTGQKYYIDNVVVNGYGTAMAATAPALSGTAKVGKTISATRGSWSGNRITYAYKWYSCTAKASAVRASAPARADKCTVIKGKTAATYKLTSKEKGKYVRVAVTATTAAGSVAVTTKSTGKIG